MFLLGFRKFQWITTFFVYCTSILWLRSATDINGFAIITVLYVIMIAMVIWIKKKLIKRTKENNCIFV